MQDAVDRQREVELLHDARRRDLLLERPVPGDAIVVLRVGALDRDLHVVEPGRLQRLATLAREVDPGGDERRVEAGVACARAELDQIAAQHRLAAREGELQDAECARLPERSDPVLRLELVAVLLVADVERVRAVRAVQRALIGQLGDQRGGPRLLHRPRVLSGSGRRPAPARRRADRRPRSGPRGCSTISSTRALPVAKLQHRRRGRVEPHGALRHEQHVLLAHVVVLQARAGDEAGAGQASGPGGCVSPRSIASSWAHSISVLKRSAATAASCCSRVRQRSTVRSSAYWASRGACTSRARK